MTVTCNDAPVPDAVITDLPDLTVDREMLPIFPTPPPAPPPLPPPPPPNPPNLPPAFNVPKPPSAPRAPPSIQRVAPKAYPAVVELQVPRCFRKIRLDSNISLDANGDTFTYLWELDQAPAPSVLSRSTMAGKVLMTRTRLRLNLLLFLHLRSSVWAFTLKLPGESCSDLGSSACSQ